MKEWKQKPPKSMRCKECGKPFTCVALRVDLEESRFPDGFCRDRVRERECYCSYCGALHGCKVEYE